MADDVETIIEQITLDDNFFNKARLMQYLKEQKKLTVKELGSKLNLTPSYVCHILRLNKLPEIVIDGYYAKLISISHLFIIARLKDHDAMSAAYEDVLSKGLTALQTEELIRERLYEVKSEGSKITREEITALKNTFMHKRNISIHVSQTRVKGKLIIEAKGSVKQTTDLLRSIMKMLMK